MGVKGAQVYPPQSNLGGTEGTKERQAIPQLQCPLVLTLAWHSEPLFYSFFCYHKRVIFEVPDLPCFFPKTPMAKSSCLSLNDWVLLAGSEESFCKSTDESWQPLGCSCKHRQGRMGSVAPASSTFAPGEHLKEMDSIAQGLWWGLKGMLQTVKEKAFFPHDQLLLCKSRHMWKPDGAGPCSGATLSCMFKKDFSLRQKGWNQTKTLLAELPAVFSYFRGLKCSQMSLWGSQALYQKQSMLW